MKFIVSLLLVLVTPVTVRAQEKKMSLQPYSECAKNIKPQATYKHYKGDLYTIITIARVEATLEEVVVYQLASSPELTWVRPVSLFNEEVEYNGAIVKRFTPVS